jgi:hypothetical protein
MKAKSTSWPRYDGLRNGLVCVFIVAILGTVASPALAKHHPGKPSELWNQYPLNVGGPPKPTATPSQQGSPTATPTPQGEATVDSHLARDVRPRNSSNGNGILLAVAGAALLAVMGIAFVVTNRRTKPEPEPTASVQLPFRPWDPSKGDTSRNGDSGQPVEAVAESDAPPVPSPETGPSPQRAGARSGDAPPVPSPETGPSLQDAGARSGDAPPLPSPETEPSLQDAGARSGGDDDGAETAHVEEKENGLVMAPERSEVEEKAQGGVMALERPQEEATAPPDHESQPVGADHKSQPGPSDRERVLVHLADGRRLQGWTRSSGAPNEQLLILDVIAAFDPEGNETPSTRADSFILRSEITSIQPIDDS